MAGPATKGTCPTEDALAAFVEARLDDKTAGEVRSHVVDCDDCSRVLGVLFGEPRHLPEPGENFGGRYRLLQILGSGSSGTVFAAHDVRLNRRVALKILRPEVVAARPELKERLHREAQALARLEHPHVVRVFDVDEVEGWLFISMALVEGSNLRGWLQQRPRGWREVLALLVNVAEALGAAHRGGLVHRDVKPDNVLVHVDGNVAVGDFGLARFVVAAGELPSGSGTVTDTTVGTPAYMAPEQLTGRDVGAASDQFAFAVMAWEALAGQRPFSGDSPSALLASIQRGPPAIELPGGARKLLARALAVDPEQRYSSLAELASRLRARLSRRRRWLVRGAATAVVVALSISTTLAVRKARSAAEPKRSCAAPASQIDKVWSAERREAIRKAFAATGVPYAPTTSASIEGRLDEWARTWANDRREVCEATMVHGTQTAELHDRRVACYDELLSSLDALITAFTRADAVAVEHALDAVNHLNKPSSCKANMLEEAIRIPTEPAPRAAMLAARDAWQRSVAAEHLGHYRELSTLAPEAVRLAEGTGNQALIAEALSVQSHAEIHAGQRDLANETEERALRLAIASGRDDRVVRSLASLAGIAAGRHRFDEGMRWSRLADAFIQRLHDPLFEAGRLEAECLLYRDAHRYEDALASARRALAIYQKAGSDEGAADNLGRMGVLELETNRLDDAALHLEQARQLTARLLGADHPDVAANLVNLAMVRERQGRFDDALQLALAAATLFERSHGARHPLVTNALCEAGQSLWQLKRWQELADVGARAVASCRREQGPACEFLAGALCLAGEGQLELGHPERALPLLDEALRSSPDPKLLPTLKFARARALWDNPSTRARARSLAAEAESEMRQAHDSDLPEVLAWRQTHR
jgi:serine/threonine-protein kinase